MRYQIWNKTDSIITPSGREFSATEWANRYNWVKHPGAKMIITTGIINGGVAMEFESTKENYKRMGAVIDDTMTDEEVLQAIQDFEDSPPITDSISAEERIAAALEAQNLIAEPETEMISTFSLNRSADENIESPAYTRIKNNYDRGLWNASMVLMASAKGHITEEEAAQILRNT